MPTEHSFTVRDRHHGTPVLRCANWGCRLVWWPDRWQPRSKCKGTAAATTAREV